MYSNRPSGARQAGFDQIPVEIQQAALLGNAKRLYGVLCSMQRLRKEPTYADLAVELHASERSIVRWVQRLVEVGLIAVRRRGQGLSNFITVLALGVRSAKLLPQKVTGWQSATRIPLLKEKKPGKNLPGHPVHGFSAIRYPGGP